MNYSKLYLVRSGSVIYLPHNLGGFDVSGCPDSENLAERIVECVVACDGISTKTLSHANNHKEKLNGINTAYEIAAKERDTYRDLCAELKEVLRNHYWNDCTKHSKAIETLITKAEAILGEKNGTAN